MADFPENLAAQAMALPPAEAIKFFEKKGFVITWDWEEQLSLNSARAFTVAKAMKMDVLQDIRDGLDKSLKNGETFATFKKNLEPRLRARGWWGKKVVKGPNGKQLVQLGSPHRLRTIYNTNIQTSYNAGRLKFQEENKSNRPYLKYIAVIDGSTRPSHAAQDGQIHPVDSPYWDVWYPPNSYNCRCSTRALTKLQTERAGGSTKADDQKPDFIGKPTRKLPPPKVDKDIEKLGT